MAAPGLRYDARMQPNERDEYVAVESAGSIAGISPRTLRYWIAGGKLPAIAGDRGKLVRLGDVLDLAALTGKGANHYRQAAGSVGNPATSAGMAAGNVAGNAADADQTALVTQAATNQLEAIRDQWLQPLIDQIRELERDRGRLEAERDMAIAGKGIAEHERDEARAAARDLAGLQERLALITDQRNEALAEIQLLRGIREVAHAQDDTDPFAVRSATAAQEASPEARSATEPVAMTPNTSHQESHVAGWLRRLLGRA